MLDKKSKTLIKNLGLLILVVFCFSFFSYTTTQISDKSKNTPYFTKTSIEIQVNNKTFSLNTEQLKADLETEVFEKPNFWNGFFVWTGFVINEKISKNLDLSHFETSIQKFEQELELVKMSEGKIYIENNSVQIKPPSHGVSIDRDMVLSELFKMASQKERKRSYKIQAETILEKPQSSLSQFNKTANLFSEAISKEIELKSNNSNISHTLIPAELSQLVVVKFNKETKKHEIKIDEELFAIIFDNYLTGAQDATFDTTDPNNVIIIPSVVGTGLEIEKTIPSILRAIELNQNNATLHIADVLEPEFTTAEAEELKIKHLVSSFTTYHPCCQTRTDNIQHFADIVDGAIVLPGEEFNLNTYVGQRTEENGFKAAGTLVKGILINTVGGGVSQFATTFFNSVYWGGYEDVAHSPHSRYFSRYPEGIEATISWPKPDLIFRNDTETGLLIKTKHTPKSITVEFYGDNDGRTVVGRHSNKKTTTRTTQSGGENSRIVTSEISEPYSEKEPKKIYRIEPLMPEDTVYTLDFGRPGYSLNVKREVSQNGKIIHNDIFKNRYLPEDTIHTVKDCKFAPIDANCETPDDLKTKYEDLYEFFEKLENGEE